ncbi:MAG TPA: hypothetical protein DCW71_06225 [Alistipes sp.]|nr:hypothetical protein [Alistipes sp.]HAW64809.1 hypothetical protein [Alistipes sp.]
MRRAVSGQPERRRRSDAPPKKTPGNGVLAPTRKRSIRRRSQEKAGGLSGMPASGRLCAPRRRYGEARKKEKTPIGPGGSFDIGRRAARRRAGRAGWVGAESAEKARDCIFFVIFAV